MKKCYLLLSMPMLLFSCTNDFDEPVQNQQERPNVVSNMTTSSVSINLNEIVTQLVTTYKSVNVENFNTTLSQKIMMLEKVSAENISFKEIKPAEFSIPTEVEVKKFLFNYDLEYNNLKVSQRVKTYFNSTLQYENNLNDLLYSISVDEQLSLNEKNLLIFTVNSLNDLDGNDFDWKRRRIVAATLGFEKSSANAVFNVALLKINN